MRSRTIGRGRRPPRIAPRPSAVSSPNASLPRTRLPLAPLGAPFRARDADGDTLAYTLTGGGVDLFTVDPTTGQIRLARNARLDREVEASYSVTVTATDPSGATDSVSVGITVTDVNEPPEAANDEVTTPEDQEVAIRVLDNDRDPEGQVLTVALRGRPGNGSVTVDNGVITYSPNRNFHGVDSFRYAASDGTRSTEATVVVSVRSLNDPPEFPAGPVERSVAPGITGRNARRPAGRGRRPRRRYGGVSPLRARRLHVRH